MSTQVYNATGGGFTGLFPNPIIAPRDPTTSDRVSPTGAPYQVFQGWNNNLTDECWIYLGSGNWVTIASIAGAITQITTDSGTAVPSGGNINLLGTANQITATASGSTITLALIGPYTPATYTAHGVLMGEGTSSIAASTAGTSGQVFTSGGGSADGAYQNIGVNSGLTGIVTANGASAWTANAVTQFAVLVGGAANAASSIAVGATGTLLEGATGANPAFTASPSVSGSLTAGTTITAGTGITSTTGNIVASAGNITATLGSVSAATTVTAGTSITATLGNITATNGNLVASTAATGLSLNPTVASGAAGTVNCDGRVGSVTFTGVSIAAAADLTLTIGNTSIAGASTRVILTMSGSTTGSAPSIKSITPSANQVAIVVTNGTGATTTTADITFDFIVLN